jgi:hypothetical protein
MSKKKDKPTPEFKLNPREDVYAQLVKYAAHCGVTMNRAMSVAGINRETVLKWKHFQPVSIRTIAAMTDDGFLLDPRRSVYDQVEAFNSNRDKGMQQAAFDAGMSTTYMRWKKKQPHTVAIIEQVVNAIDFIKDPSMGVMQEGL